MGSRVWRLQRCLYELEPALRGAPGCLARVGVGGRDRARKALSGVLCDSGKSGITGGDAPRRSRDRGRSKKGQRPRSYLRRHVRDVQSQRRCDEQRTRESRATRGVDQRDVSSGAAGARQSDRERREHSASLRRSQSLERARYALTPRNHSHCAQSSRIRR